MFIESALVTLAGACASGVMPASSADPMVWMYRMPWDMDRVSSAVVAAHSSIQERWNSEVVFVANSNGVSTAKCGFACLYIDMAMLFWFWSACVEHRCHSDEGSVRVTDHLLSAVQSPTFPIFTEQWIFKPVIWWRSWCNCPCMSRYFIARRLIPVDQQEWAEIGRYRQQRVSACC